MGDFISDMGKAATVAFPTAALGTGLEFGSAWLEADAARQAQNKRADFEQAMWQKNYELQKEFAKNGIRWRTEDAQAAGIHPLYAIGANTNSGSPISVGDIGFAPNPMSTALSKMSQNVSKSIRMQMTPEEKMKQDLELQLLKSQIGETDARKGYYDAQSANLLSADHASGPMFMSESDYKFPQYFGDGTIQLAPVKQYSRSLDDPTSVAGRHPVWGKFDLFKGIDPVALPYSDSENPFENLEGSMPFALTVMKNIQNMREKSRKVMKRVREKGFTKGEKQRFWKEAFQP